MYRALCRPTGRSYRLSSPEAHSPEALIRGGECRMCGTKRSPVTERGTRMFQRVLSYGLLAAFLLPRSEYAMAQPPSKPVVGPPRFVLRVCNEGNVEASVALVRTVASLTMPGNAAEGWWRVRPSTCEIVYDTPIGNGAWVAFIFQDRAGVWRSYHSTPKDAGVQAERRYDHGALARSFLPIDTQFFCVSWQKFSVIRLLGHKDLRECPAGTANRYVIPFTANFRDPLSETTYTIKPDENGPGRAIEGAPATPPGRR